jgi:hypothetical protein
MTGALQGAFLVFLAGIGGTVFLGLRSQNLSVIVNGVASFVAALAPDIVGFVIYFLSGVDVTFDPGLSLWIAIAGFLHMLGMLGWYDSVWWWDHLTHTVSAALLTALVYASLLVYSSHSPEVQLADTYTAVLTILFTLAIGVFWEFIELAARELGMYIDRPPVLKYYGLYDTVFDMIFNGVGAVVIVAFDIRVFVPLAEQAPQIMGALVFGSAIALSVGTVCLGLLLEAFVSLTRDSKRC